MTTSHIIFDLNRTLYDPDAGELMPGAREVLASVYREGIRLTLISRNEPGRRDIVKEMGIEPYFSRILLVDEKTPHLYAEVIAESGIATDNTVVVGDYLGDDVRCGNACGATTVWFRAGKFAVDEPDSEETTPSETITALRELLRLL